MPEIVWTIPALEYLKEIADIIALDNAGCRKKIVKQVFERVEKLADFLMTGMCQKY